MYSFLNVFIIIFFCVCLKKQLHAGITDPTDNLQTDNLHTDNLQTDNLQTDNLQTDNLQTHNQHYPKELDSDYQATSEELVDDPSKTYLSMEKIRARIEHPVEEVIYSTGLQQDYHGLANAEIKKLHETVLAKTETHLLSNIRLPTYYENFKEDLKTFIKSLEPPGRGNLELLFRLLEEADTRKPVNILELARAIRQVIRTEEKRKKKPVLMQITQSTAWYNFLLHPLTKVFGSVEKNEMMVSDKAFPRFFFSITVKDTDPLYDTIKEIPINFDARRRWTKCGTLIGKPIDQGPFQNSWAVATCGAFADRLCIKTNGKFCQTLSVEELTFCCLTCSRNGDGFSNNYKAWVHFQEVGAVTGGTQGTSDGCLPYTIRPCINDDKKNTCETGMYVLGKECPDKCSTGYAVKLEEDRRKVKNTYLISTIKNIQKEIMTHGPVTASFKKFEDFSLHEKGIYEHKRSENFDKSEYYQYHVVKIIGWGENEDGAYWLCVNTYGKLWGDRGTFKIAKGRNECEIEERVIAGLPSLDMKK